MRSGALRNRTNVVGLKGTEHIYYRPTQDHITGVKACVLAIASITYNVVVLQSRHETSLPQA